MARKSGTIGRVIGSRAPLVCSLIAAAAAAACGRPAARGLGSTGALRGANVLLITIDTLRQDRVGAYGNTSRLTRTSIGSPAAACVTRTRFRPAPLTLPAHASILTGLLPAHHGIHNNTEVPARRARADARQRGQGRRLSDGRVRRRVRTRRPLRAQSRLRRVRRSAAPRRPRVVSFRRAARGRGRRRGGGLDSLWGLGAAARGSASPQSPVPELPAPAPSPWFAWVHLFDPHAPVRRAGRVPHRPRAVRRGGRLRRRHDRPVARPPRRRPRARPHARRLDRGPRRVARRARRDDARAVRLQRHAGGAARAERPVARPGDRRRAGLARRRHADDARPARSRAAGTGRRPVARPTAVRRTGRCTSRRSTPR